MCRGDRLFYSGSLGRAYRLRTRPGLHFRVHTGLRAGWPLSVGTDLHMAVDRRTVRHGHSGSYDVARDSAAGKNLDALSRLNITLDVALNGDFCSAHRRFARH